jgi:hypothetical protein
VRRLRETERRPVIFLHNVLSLFVPRPYGPGRYKHDICRLFLVITDKLW